MPSGFHDGSRSLQDQLRLHDQAGVVAGLNIYSDTPEAFDRLVAASREVLGKQNLQCGLTASGTRSHTALHFKSTRRARALPALDTRRSRWAGS